MIHQLKTEEKYFDDVVKSKKTFEVRKNDRNFAIGDYLALNETAEAKGISQETGRCCIVQVTYLLNDPRFVHEDLVILGIEPCSINRASRATIHGERKTD